jgi:hypothetical protein
MQRLYSAEWDGKTIVHDFEGGGRDLFQTISAFA